MNRTRRKRGRFSWLRENHRFSCPPKIGHDTEQEAQVHLDSLVIHKGESREGLNIYRCLECHMLHVGHKISLETRARETA
jgi:hypothetical protein